MHGGREAGDPDDTDRGNAPQPLRRDSTATVSRGLWSSNRERRKKLILHIDLNNTILISDAVTTQGTVAALEYFLTTVTWGRMSREGKVSEASLHFQFFFIVCGCLGFEGRGFFRSTLCYTISNCIIC